MQTGDKLKKKNKSLNTIYFLFGQCQFFFELLLFSQPIVGTACLNFSYFHLFINIFLISMYSLLNLFIYDLNVSSFSCLIDLELSTNLASFRHVVKCVEKRLWSSPYISSPLLLENSEGRQLFVHARQSRLSRHKYPSLIFQSSCKIG